MNFLSTARRHARRLAGPLALASASFLHLGWLGGPQNTLDPQGPVARSQMDVFYVTLWVTMIIFVLVAAVLTYATLKFRARSAADEHAEPPPQSHGNPLVEIGLIVLSIVALVFIAVPTLRAIWYTYDVPAELRDQTYEVTAIGYQWWFEFEYPAEQIEGVGPLVNANELVIPAGRPIRVNLRTDDVIHSFWVPKLAGKVDMIPNRGNFLWMMADEPGYFWGQCAEFCGESHAVMRFRVIALEQSEFDAWVAAQKQPARTVAHNPDAPAVEFASYPMPGTYRRNLPGWTKEFDDAPKENWRAMQLPRDDEDSRLIARGREVFVEKTCHTCHTVRGHEGIGRVGPDLTHMGSRTTIAAGLLENTPENLHRWLVDPNGVKPGNLMYFGRKMPGYKMRGPDTDHEWVENFSVNDEEARALVAYLLSLK